MQLIMKHVFTNITAAITNTTTAVIVKLSIYIAHLRFKTETTVVAYIINYLYFVNDFHI